MAHGSKDTAQGTVAADAPAKAMQEPIKNMSDATKKALDPEPLPGPETVSEFALALDLVAHARAVITRLENDRAKQNVPPRQQHAKVVPAQRAGAVTFMPDVDAVVQPVKARADPEPLAQPAKPQPQPQAQAQAQAQVGMLKALAELAQGPA